MGRAAEMTFRLNEQRACAQTQCQVSGAFFLALCVPLILTAAFASSVDAEPVRLYVTVDKSEVISLPQEPNLPREPFTKVSVANPAVADVLVITPAQILLSGKAAGVTSLVVFYPRGVEQFDVVVHATPPMDVKTQLAPSEALNVVIHRAGKISNHFFVRDKGRAWVELEMSKPEPEAGKK